MNRSAYAIVSSLIVTGSAFAGFYWLARPIGKALGISEFAHGLALIPVLAICIGTVVVGTVVGLFLFPLALRPFVSPTDFWGWIGTAKGVTIPILDPLLERWASLLYGKRIHPRKSRNT
jgi:hypothetical protein